MGEDMNSCCDKPSQPQNVMSACCGRQTGPGVLRDVIDALRRKAYELEILHNMLPNKLTPQQDEAIWGIACSIRQSL